jgi:high affinity Mn2+ porin
MNRSAFFLTMMLGVSRCLADGGGGSPVAPLPAGANSEPGRSGPATPDNAPATTGPAASANQPAVGFATTDISFEIPTLSGTLIDQFAYTFHGQATSITQYHGDFYSPYAGPNSFTSAHEVETSFTGTLFTGIRVVPGTEIYFDPEVSAGSGLSGVLGLGDPPNGETPRVSGADPAETVARLFLRQTFGFGGPQQDVPDGANLIAEKQDVSRLVVTLGKFAANDIFDNNTYAHDPRSQFSNWGLWEDAAWDYPADTKGYTDGLTLELYQPNWTLRYGIFRPPANANGGQLDTDWRRAFDQVLEFEQRYTAFGQPGVVRPMGYFNYAHMGDYRDAIDDASGRADTGTYPNVAATRSYAHPKYGVGVSAEQAITSDFGIFARAGWNNGQSESWAFTEVDRTISLGVSIKGTRWHRPDDVIGIGGVMSGLSKDHRDYLATGGLGFELGDRRLGYAPEEVVEAYYLATVTKNLFLTVDYQFIDHPGYNADRGPVSVVGFRAHVEF